MYPGPVKKHAFAAFLPEAISAVVKNQQGAVSRQETLSDVEWNSHKAPGFTISHLSSKTVHVVKPLRRIQERREREKEKRGGREMKWNTWFNLYLVIHDFKKI